MAEALAGAPGDAGARSSRIDACFAGLRAADRCALIPYLTAGFPHPGSTVPLMEAMVRGGADLIELGVPFSDPMADGLVIQRANEQALAGGTRLVDVLAAVARFRERDRATPIVLMGYCNPVERMGVAAFVERARAAGVDGVILVDCPPEEGEGLAEPIARAGIDTIFLLAPTSDRQRIDAVARAARGYVYYVSLKGVTGAGHIDTDDVARQVSRLRQAVRLPVGVGFGIRDSATAARIAAFADAVVIGTRVIEVVGDGPAAAAAERLETFLGAVRTAIDAARSRIVAGVAS
jgi:tryptophan synthase alpha chain